MGFSYYMNLTDSTFINLLATRSLVLQAERNQVESLRVLFYRKLQAHIEQWDAIGYLADDLRDTTISVAFDREKKIGTLSIVKRKPRLQFTILSGTPDHEEVSAHLEYDQDCQIQHGSADSNPSEHGAHLDSGSAERESNGQCSTEEDWESELRKFVQQDSDSQNQA